MPHRKKPKSISLPVATLAHAASARADLDKARKKKELWYDEGLRFKCTECGNCCTGGPGYVWLTIDDMIKIAGHLGLPLDEFTRAYVKRVGTRYSLMEHVNYDCVFLKRDPATGKAGCSIYQVRPTQCRTWPFWNQNLRSPEVWASTAEHCPGMCDAEGEVFDAEFIERCRTHPESP